ncbi:MAG: DUF5977 domain-containing protein [Ferruginibacter sp.]
MKRIFLVILLVKLHSLAFSQVNLQTGSATFSLPMFNWQDNKSRLNSVVALNYSSGNGLKVNDVASNVGQGWNLLAGGVINRMQIGEPDDQVAYPGKGDHSDQDISKYPAGILFATVPAFKGCPTALTRYPIYGWKNQVYTQRTVIAEDRQLDYFSFQFNGKAGMFVLDPTNVGVARSLGDTKMKITFQLADMMSLGRRTSITSFSVQDIDGLIYKFTLPGLTKVMQFNYCDASLNQSWTQPKFEEDQVYHQAGFDNGEFSNPWVIDSWYLSEIVDPLTHRNILFDYTTRYINNTAGADISYNYEKDYSIVSHKTSNTETPEINSITYPDGHKVTFNYGSARFDLTGELALSAIDITYQGRYISKYKLNTSYFILNRYGTPVSAYQKSVARLCLMSVQKIGIDLKEDTPPYIFDYYLGSTNAPDDFIPPPFFYAKDIWGFYNGSNSRGFTDEVIPLNSSLSQLSNRQTKGLCFLHNGVPGVYLNAKTGYARNGLLRQIIHPTGGTLAYQYEQNSGVLNATSGNVGGVHVSQTSATDGGYSNGCSNPINTQYNYVMNGTGSASSLWGLEMPVNYMTSNTHYQPEYKSYHYTFPFGECYWKYSYPGILSQQQSISLTGIQQFLSSIAPVLEIVSIVSTIMDVATVITGGSPVALIIDIIGGLLNIGLTCIGNHADDFSVTVYYNSDMNGVAPLPTQFKRVEVVENTGTIGKTVQEFTSDDDYAIWEPTNPVFSAKQRFAPWAYGLPKLTTVYDVNGNIVKQTENIYNSTNAKRIIDGCIYHPGPNFCDPDNTTGINSNLISCKCLVTNSSSQRNSDWSDPLQYNNSYLMASSADLKVDFYGMYTGRTELRTTNERIFKTSDPTQYLETVTDYSYNLGWDDQNYEVNRIRITESNGVTNIRYISYAADYASSQNVALTTLVQNNNGALPVSTYSSVYDPSVSYYERALSEKVTEFTQLSTGDIQPARVIEQRFTQPNNTASRYWPDNVNNSSIYKTIQSFTYDVSGNLIGQKDEGNRILTNIYDYQDKYVVANIINADALTDNSAYSSFESTGFGGWSLTGSGAVYVNNGVTGIRSFTLNGNTFTRSSLNTVKLYILSFWADNTGITVTGGATLIKSAPTTNGFTYYEYSLALGTSSVSVSGTANIDELRLYPASGRMRTVTYDPLIGKTSECDENNRISYYDYDNLGRLQYIKDESRNIVKMYEYNTISAAKQNGCPTTYYNKLVSEVFKKSNCGAGYIGSDVTYTLAANTYSSAISQADADVQAENYILTNGQAYANTNGTCTQLYYNTAQSQSYSRESCPVGFTGASITYTVPANRYTSTISLADANQKALNEIAANGDAYANAPANSICTIDYNPTWSWLEGAASYCSFVNGSNHLFIQQTNINPNSSSFNQTRWNDVGVQDACPQQSCAFAPSPGFNLITSSISNSGNTVSFYIVFNSSSGNTYWSSTNQVASINGGCTPSVTNVFTMTENGRTWEVVISSFGSFNVRLLSGTAPTGTSYIALTGGSYTL